MKKWKLVLLVVCFFVAMFTPLTVIHVIAVSGREFLPLTHIKIIWLISLAVGSLIIISLPSRSDEDDDDDSNDDEIPTPEPPTPSHTLPQPIPILDDRVSRRRENRPMTHTKAPHVHADRHSAHHLHSCISNFHDPDTLLE